MEVDYRLKDWGWRIANLYKIVDKDQKLIKFRPNVSQNSFNKNRHNRNIILKARQLGFTTNACITGLDDVLFKRNFNMVIIAHERDAVTKIFKKVKLAWEHFPSKLKEFMQIKANTDSANKLSFNNGSSISVALSTRSDTVNRLHISEFGKICKKYPLKAEEIITGAFPSVPKSGRIDIESTAEGDYGHFYEMFDEAWLKEPENELEFRAFFFPWFKNKEYRLKGSFDISEDLRKYQNLHELDNVQINWYFFKKKELKTKITQEYPTTPEEAFLGAGNKMFDLEALEAQETEEGKKIGDWTVFAKYNPKHSYAMGADVAEGIGQDSSTAVIFDFTSSKVVATYRSNKVAPDVFAHVLAKMGEIYGVCLIAPERNNHGHTTLATLKGIYDNIYVEKKFDKTKGGKTNRLGWHTNLATKPKMMYELKDVVNEGEIKLVDKALIREAKTYDLEDLRNVKFDELQTKHWDLLIAMAIAWQMRDNTKKGVSMKEYEKAANCFIRLIDDGSNKNAFDTMDDFERQAENYLSMLE